MEEPATLMCEVLSEAMVSEGPMAGLNVGEVLDMAEQAVGGFPEKMERQGLNVETLTDQLRWLNTRAPKCQPDGALSRP